MKRATTNITFSARENHRNARVYLLKGGIGAALDEAASRAPNLRSHETNEGESGAASARPSPDVHVHDFTTRGTVVQVVDAAPTGKPNKIIGSLGNNSLKFITEAVANKRVEGALPGATK